MRYCGNKICPEIPNISHRNLWRLSKLIRLNGCKATVPKIGSQNSMANDEVKFFEVWHKSIVEQHVATGDDVRISTFTKLRRHLFSQLRLLLQRHRHQFVLLHCGFWLAWRERRILFLQHKRPNLSCRKQTALSLHHSHIAVNRGGVLSVS